MVTGPCSVHDPVAALDYARRLAGLRRSLDEMVVDGIETTLPLFRALVREPDIIDGDYHIHWLEQYLAGQAASPA